MGDTFSGPGLLPRQQCLDERILSDICYPCRRNDSTLTQDVSTAIARSPKPRSPFALVQPVCLEDQIL